MWQVYGGLARVGGSRKLSCILPKQRAVHDIGEDLVFREAPPVIGGRVWLLVFGCIPVGGITIVLFLLGAFAIYVEGVVHWQEPSPADRSLRGFSMSYVAEKPQRPSHAEDARTLLAASSRGVLATLAAEDGYPYASVVELAPTADGNILLLLSNLAVHTRNITADDRASVVVAEHDVTGEILALGRATYKGRIRKMEDPGEARRTYLNLHPSAAAYVDFADFNFYRLVVEEVRYIGGFGRMSWVRGDMWTASTPDPLAPFARGVIEHMNEDHAHNLLDYAHAFADADWCTEATMVRLDQLGFDLRVADTDRSEEVRVGFASPKTTHDEVHEVMVRLARAARELLGK